MPPDEELSPMRWKIDILPGVVFICVFRMALRGSTVL